MPNNYSYPTLKDLVIIALHDAPKTRTELGEALSRFKPRRVSNTLQRLKRWPSIIYLNNGKWTLHAGIKPREPPITTKCRWNCGKKGWYRAQRIHLCDEHYEKLTLILWNIDEVEKVIREAGRTLRDKASTEDKRQNAIALIEKVHRLVIQ